MIGSQWSKWDLHLHTPFTKINNNYEGPSTDEIWSKFCHEIEKSDVQVFGITDYFQENTFFEFLNHHKARFPNSTKKFFANIEFRLEVSVNRTAEEVNIHIIFSDNVDQRALASFLTKLNTNRTKNGALISCKHLSTNEDYNSAAVNYKDILKHLEEVFGNERPYIIITAANNAGLRADTNSPRKMTISDELDKISDGFFGSSKNVEWFLTSDRYETNEVSKPKPVLSGCDAHSFPDLTSTLGKRVTKQHSGATEIHKDVLWIKAEHTFSGLLQVFNEPSRAFLGLEPPVLTRVSANPTKYIKSLDLKKLPSAPFADKWFDGLSIQLNPELVAIIGNKGRGKSALADILGLTGNAHIEQEDFSFLNRDKFKNPKSNFANHFESTMTWEGGTPQSVNLNNLPDNNAPERVKYIPQSFLEKLCSSLDKSIFEEELEKMIFSRLEESQRLGKSSLKEILIVKRHNFDVTLRQLKSDISAKNEEIVELERKDSPSFRKTITESVIEKQNELQAHDEKQPAEKRAPNGDDDSRARSEGILEEIGKLRLQLLEQQKIKGSLEKEQLENQVSQSELTSLKGELSGILEFSESIKARNSDISQKYKLNLNSLVNVIPNFEPLDKLIDAVKIRGNEILEILRSDNINSPTITLAQTEAKIIFLQEGLEGDNKEYQEYLTALSEWQNKRELIEGKNDKEGSLKYYQAISLYLEKELLVELERERINRSEILRAILKVKNEIASSYRELYRPVTEFIEENRSQLSDYQIGLDVVLEPLEFEDLFFDFISQGIAGTFYGTSEGRAILKQITETKDFNLEDDVLLWINEILDRLYYDRREGQHIDHKKELATLLKRGYSEKEFYDFLFSMTYYEPSFQLRMGTKTMTELSPGERGALLLIFYLLLDKKDIPIIIDQPEENLDNQSVYHILVQFVKKAKTRRQIILITHNPNLAVVCDAEQIIRMTIAKDQLNAVSMITGGIENPKINKAIVDILEGTMPAFKNRTSKYLLVHSDEN